MIKTDVIHKVFKEIEDRGSIERTLWRHVLFQIICDATSKIRRSEDIIIKHNSIQYIRGNNKDFKLICQFAELDFYQVRERFLFFVENPHLFKRKSGVKKMLPTLKVM